MRRQRRIDGFTLLETIMVLVIVGLMVTVLAPRWKNFMTAWNLETEARKIMGRIRETQQLAIHDQIFYRVSFDVSNSVYKIWKGDSDGYNWSEIDEIDTQNQGIKIVSTSSSGPVIFDAFGAASGNDGPYPEARIGLKDPGSGESAFVYVDDVTGRVWMP